jgi:pimeloyl-ACP methyl ester carboxylesterase
MSGAPPRADAAAFAAAAQFLSALESQSTQFETPCGTGRMVWRRWNEGGGEPVVLLHGGGGAWSHWARNIEVLARSRQVWVPDLPGLGDSDLPEAINVEDIAAPIARGLQALLPQRAFDLVTFSFGGPVGCCATAVFGLPVRHLVLSAARFVLEDRNVFPKLARWKELTDEDARMAAHRRNLELMMIADPAHIDALALTIQSQNTPKARYAGPPLQPGEKLHRYLPQVRVTGSITAISGTLDHVAQPIMDQQATGLQRLQPGARFHPIAGAGHWVQYEAAEAYNPLLLAALGIAN